MQIGTRGDRRECEHARGHPQRQGALRGARAQEVAVRRLVQRRHPGQSDGGRRPGRVRLLAAGVRGGLAAVSEGPRVDLLRCCVTGASTSPRPP